MRTIYLIIITLILFPSTILADDLVGRYAAVTETEAVIELELKEDNTALLITGYLPIEPDESFVPHVRNGRWFQNEGLLIVQIKDLGTLQYRIMKFLPYDEFGHKGGSFGLSPEKSTEEPFNRFGLWRKSDLLRHFKK